MNKENIEPGDILESDTGITAIVKSKNNNSIKVSIEDQKNYIMDNQLCHWNYCNPIINNRIVSSKTFAIRFKQFLEWIPKDWWMSQPHYYEEYEYMISIANKLLKYQIQTASEPNEIEYLKRLKLL